MGPSQQKRNRQFGELAALVQAVAETNVVVCGDFNDTPWSPSFKQFRGDTRLRDARDGFGYQASWPSKLGLVGIPIDHVMASDTIAVVGCETRFTTADSDHAMVTTVFQIPPETQAAAAE